MNTDCHETAKRLGAPFEDLAFMLRCYDGYSGPRRGAGAGSGEAEPGG